MNYKEKDGFKRILLTGEDREDESSWGLVLLQVGCSLGATAAALGTELNLPLHLRKPWGFASALFGFFFSLSVKLPFYLESI